jgi:hypothetical protein
MIIISSNLVKVDDYINAKYASGLVNDYNF